MSAYSDGSSSSTSAYLVQYQQHASNGSQYTSTEIAAYWAYWDSPAGLAARQAAYNSPAYAQNAQQYSASTQLSEDIDCTMAPPLPSETLAPSSTTSHEQHAPSGSQAPVAELDPPVPGPELVVAATDGSQPPLPPSGPWNTSHAAYPPNQQASLFPANQHGTSPVVAADTAAAQVQYNAAAQLLAQQLAQQQQYAQQTAAWSTLTLEQQRQQYATYNNNPLSQQASYASQQQAYQIGPGPQSMAPHQAVTFTHPPDQADWAAPPSSQPQQHPQFHNPYNVQPPHAPSLPPPTPNGMTIRPQRAKRPAPHVASHPSTFSSPSALNPQDRPTAYTQVGVATPQAASTIFMNPPHANSNTHTNPLPPEASAANGTSHPNGQTKRSPWGPVVQDTVPSPAPSRFGDASEELGQNDDVLTLGHRQARDDRGNNKQGKPSRTQRKAAAQAALNDDTISCPVDAGSIQGRLSAAAAAFAAAAATSTAAAAAQENNKRQRNSHAVAARSIVPPPLPAYVVPSHVPDVESSSDDEETKFDINACDIKGTCLFLEKPYFRLTGAPKPSEVRPSRVLKAALDLLLTQYTAGQVTSEYVIDQLKAMRQDVTVQRLVDTLAMVVYETSTRLALKYGDFAELHQCLTQLHSMYQCNGNGGSRAEIVGYTLLFQSMYAHRGLHKALLHTMQGITPELAATFEVAHALEVRQAIQEEDYFRFFRLHRSAPNLGRAIMDVAVPRIRWVALTKLLKAFKFKLPVSFFAKRLGFMPILPKPTSPPSAEVLLPGCTRAGFVGKFAAATSAEQGMAACVQWLTSHGAVLVTEPSMELAVDVQLSVGVVRIPTEVAKVAHGDERLSIASFFATKPYAAR